MEKKIIMVSPPCCRELKKENKKKVFILEHPWPNRGKKGRGKSLRKSAMVVC